MSCRSPGGVYPSMPCRFPGPHLVLHISILWLQGERLLQGLSADLYSVRIGQGSCEVIQTTSNLITCRPPKDEPDQPGENRPRVQVC